MVKSTQQLVTVTQAANQLGLTAVRVRQFCQEGRIGFKVGGLWLIEKKELREFARKKRSHGVSLKEN